MTLRDLLMAIGRDTRLAGLVLGGPPVLALIVGFFHRRAQGNEAPWKYIYSVLVYAACIPGLLATVLTAYELSFGRANLMNLEVVVFLLPILTMAVTLVLIGRKADFGPLPGFGRLSGLMVMIALTFVVLVVITKTRIFLFFGSSIWTLVLFGAFVFALIRWGAYMAFRDGESPEKPAPKLPG